MQIIQIIPGSGNRFYCGNCLRDSKYVQALRAMGHEVIKIPMYLPLFADQNDRADMPVFYGAVSIYLKQQVPIFRHAPVWIDRLLNSKPVLNLAAGLAGSTRAAGLEEMTISMLKGEDGRQEAELKHMVKWIATHCRPDIVHLSNALLLGLARRIKEKLQIPVVCSLQDEDMWIEVMRPEARQQIWALMAEKACNVDAFISVSDYYRQHIQSRMNIPNEKLQYLHLGIDYTDYDYISPSKKPKNIGFLSRLCVENGLDILVDAFILLYQKHKISGSKLILSGGSTHDDSSFLNIQIRKLKKAGLFDQTVFHSDFSETGRKQFFNEVAVLSVPVPKGEAFGIYLLEALASGVPVVQPHLGAYPEIITTSGGGLTYQPNLPESLAAVLKDVLFNDSRLQRFSEQGRNGIEKYFSLQKQAGKIIEVFEKMRQGYAATSNT